MMTYKYQRPEDDDEERPLKVDARRYSLGSMHISTALQNMVWRIERIEAALGLTIAIPMIETRGNRDIGWRVFVDGNPVTEPALPHEAEREADHRLYAALFPTRP